MNLRVSGILIGHVIGNQHDVARARIVAMHGQGAGTQGAHAMNRFDLFFVAMHAFSTQRFVGQLVEVVAHRSSQAVVGALAHHVLAGAAEEPFGLPVGQQNLARYGVFHDHAGRNIGDDRVQKY